MNIVMDQTQGIAHQHVLCVVAWWPEGNSVAGTFIKEHIIAVAHSCTVEVVHVHLVKGNRPWPSREIRTSNADGIRVHSITIRTPIRRFGSFEYLVRKAYTELAKELHSERPFDLMHIHVRNEITEHALPIAEALDLPVVVTEHASHYHLGILDLPAKQQQAERASILKWFSNDRIVRVMPVSKNLAGILKNDFGVREERIDVVPNIAAPVFIPAGNPPKKPFRIMLGALWRPPKDPDLFIDALASIPSSILQDTIIDWTGYGPFMERIQARCTKLIPNLDIRFPGLLTKAQMAEYMQTAHLFVLPTTTENLPCVILESLCCGTPVLSMNINGIPEMVNDSNGILIPPRDVQAMADALVKILKEPLLFNRDAIAKAALERFAQEPVRNRILLNYRIATSKQESS
ncbi:MAG: glycosyltransferase [Flavobacteriales bacterium]|nr:glycosyltransferase [Flavobacteriales bacterium]